MSSLTFCASVYQRLHGVCVVRIYHAAQGSIDPPSCLDAVQAAHHDGELHVEILVEVLDLVVVRCDLDALHPLLHKLGSHLGLGLAHVVFPEKELSVQVRDVDGVCRASVSRA